MTSQSASSSPIWAKRSIGTIGRPVNKEAQERAIAYCAGRDVLGRPPADAELIPYDLWTNRAHCQMLRHKNIIDDEAFLSIMSGLKTLEDDWRTGRFELDPLLEDVHMNLEAYVKRMSGEVAAGVMHTARSRNDQSATDMRLWLRDRLLERTIALTSTVKALASFAQEYASVIAPGWTHAQPAMPTTLGHWAISHACGLMRDVEAMIALWPLINQSPLGAAASFGTSWPIDRELTAQLLGFDKVQENSLDCISTRWESEARVASVFSIMMTHLSSLGQDLIFLSTPPRRCLRLNGAHVTGSSIMPNKRNPDFSEVTRARAQSTHSLTQSLLGVGRGALSGYNRDTQWTKYWIMDLVNEVGVAPEVFTDVVKEIEVNVEELEKFAVEGFSLAADFADYLANTRKLPFRKAYHIIAESVAIDELEGWFRLETLNQILEREALTPLLTQSELDTMANPLNVLAKRKSLGAPEPEQVRSLASRLFEQATSACHHVTKLQNHLFSLQNFDMSNNDNPLMRG